MVAAPRHIAALTAALAAVVSLAGCGSGSSPGQALVRVGDAPITRATLSHWMTVMRGGPGDPAGGGDNALRRQALQFLISSQWLIGEASHQGLSIDEREVRKQVEREEQTSFPGGPAELRQFLKSTGQSVADVELQARSELARAKLRGMLDRSAGRPTRAQIAFYYARNRGRFHVPVRREARFTNRKTRAAAEKLKREVEAGKSLTSPAQRRVGELFAGAGAPPSQRNDYERAIFAAPPHRVAGPFHIHADYFLYEVAKVIPATTRTLRQVEGQIRKQLLDERRRQTLGAFIKAWRARWTARTDCAPGYVVQKCRQYRGPLAAEDALELK
jgi:foldase protein PrsA